MRNMTNRVLTSATKRFLCTLFLTEFFSKLNSSMHLVNEAKQFTVAFTLQELFSIIVRRIVFSADRDENRLNP